jgi:alpha-tubulin suppressor-like RCC1 family protein
MPRKESSMKRVKLRTHLAVSSTVALAAVIVSGCADSAAPQGEAHGDGTLGQATSALLTGNTCVYGQPCQSAEATATIQRGGGVGNVFDTGINDNGVSSNAGSGTSGTIPIGDSGSPTNTPRQELMNFDPTPITNLGGAGYNIVGAQVSLYFCTNAAGQTINVHEASQSWGATTAQFSTYETTVSWPSFNESFVATPITSFGAGASNSFPGCVGSGHTPNNARFDISSLVSDWVNGTAAQDGILLEQPPVVGVSTTVLTSEYPPALSGYHPTLFVQFNVTCATGTADCNDNGLDGCETDITATQNCGACGNACAAGDTCVDGACVQPCNPGFTACSGVCVNESTDPDNCGACGVTCDVPPSSCYAASGTCSSGACVYNPLPINTTCPGGLCDGVGDCTPCPAGLSLCGATCVSETNDPDNCGGCGNACPSGDVCSGGTCSSAYQAVQIGVGAEFACAVLSTGSVECWGGVGTGFGELGNGATGGSTTPVFVSGIYDAKAVFAAAFNACALLSTGSVVCWGDNAEGQLGDGTTTNRSTPVPVVGLTNAVSVAGATTPSANNSFTCAVLATGGVECWGANGFGQLGDGTTISHSTPAPVQGISTALAVTAGDGFACALLAGGTVSCWGNMSGGTIRYGTTPVAVAGISGAAGVSASYDSACAVFPNGTVECWGANNQGQLGDGSFSTSTTPVQVSGLTTSTAIQGSCGSTAATHCAGTFSGGAYCWGNNNFGQIGDGNTSTSDTPQTVTGLTGAVAIASGGGAGTGQGSSCAIVGSGAVVCWGSNQYGQLGNGTQTSSSTFVQVFGL